MLSSIILMHKSSKYYSTGHRTKSGGIPDLDGQLCSSNRTWPSLQETFRSAIFSKRDRSPLETKRLADVISRNRHGQSNSITIKHSLVDLPHGNMLVDFT